MLEKYDFRILVIDDNPEIHRDFLRILTNMNNNSSEFESLKQKLFSSADEELSLPVFQIDTASQGKEGVDKIAQAIEQKKPYSLAFVDIRMPPGWDGIETIKHIWELDKDIQIVICTAYSDYSWEETINQLGQTDNLLILKKPFDFIAVRQLASALTRKWQLLQETQRYLTSLEERVRERTDTLQQSLSRLRATLESSTDGIVVVDTNKNVIDYNQKFLTMWDLLADEMTPEIKFDTILNKFKKYTENNNFFKILSELGEGHEKIIIDVVKLKNHKIFEYYSQPQKLNDETIGRVYSFRDITRRANLEESLQHQATHDSLTELPNRVFLQDAMRKNILRSRNQNNEFAILFFDLDRFKLINDSLSHAAGDNLLQIVSKRLKATVREYDVVARLGGDEFIVMLQDPGNEEEIKKITNKLLVAISKPFMIEEREITITSSIGICRYPQDGSTVEELLRNADAAMYKAKKSGANRFQFYSEELNRENIEYLEKEMQLRHAIINNELFLFYQPQIDIVNQKLIAVEALVRWRHPEKGIILPIDFIPLAEETGLIIPIGEWVLRESCRQNKAWQDAGFPKIRVAVNITTQQLNQFNLVDIVKGILEETQLSPEYLELELTENSIVSNSSVINTINTLKDLGIHIALDDFGTGYSSLAYLKNIHLDRLKIDRSFVQNIEMNRGDEVIIQAIITMAKSLNLEVLAEGVETEEQIEFLKKQQCCDIQGFYFSKPLTSSQIEEVFSKKWDLMNVLVKDA